MFETKYNKFLTILLVIIIVAIIGLLGYLGYNYFVNYTIKNDSDQFVSTFVEEVGDTTKNNTTGDEGGSIADDITSAQGNSSNGKKQMYKGFEMIGTIEIPKTGANYPILVPLSAKALETAVVAAYPSNPKLNTVGNVVIIGHNYRNGLFFSNNKKLSNGDKIHITDLDKNKVTYKIYNIFQAEPNDASFYNRDTDGAKEITLSTCSDDTKSRIIIEARAE